MDQNLLHILDGRQHVHFIGIGGSGMFPLAQILHSRGYYLTGSDNNETDTLAAVRKMGIPVMLGQRAENIQGADLIVHTAAILPDNPELIAAKASGVPVLERSVLLGIVTTWYPNAFCVSGTHGKTTTTAMLTQILLESGLDISAYIGGKLPAIGGSGRTGNSDILTCEACEFVDTFLKLSPAVAVILNIDADHLDYFGTLDNIILSFRKFASLATKAVVYNGDDANTRKAVENLTPSQSVTFGRSDQNDWYPAEIRHISGMETHFTLMHQGKPYCTLVLHVPGEHNVLNAVAACAAAVLAGAGKEGLQKGLDAFYGTSRRFEKLGVAAGVTVADDYAHHPTELEATLKTAKQLNFRKVWALFQPFTFSRTAMLLEDFARVLTIADHTILTEIMGSREKNTWNIYARDLGAKMPEDRVTWFDDRRPEETEQQFHDRNFTACARYAAEHAQPGDLVITLGCGDVNKAAKELLQMLKEKETDASGSQ